jgi:cystathionine beta-lyase/cystathionine gamma-synthase
MTRRTGPPAERRRRNGLHHPETAAVSEGFDPALSMMAARPPIYPVSTYCFRSAADAKKYFAMAVGKLATPPGGGELIYARLDNPNAAMFEEMLVPLERGATAAVSFCSGMAAITTTLLGLLRPGDVVLHTEPLYGGTAHLLEHLLGELGIAARGVPAGEAGALEAAAIELGDRLAMIYVETPANPTLRMTDIAAAAAAARAARGGRPALLAVDNTFLGPVFQSPLLHGADLVLYSATKYIGGHSDVIAGAVLARDRELVARVKAARAFFGTICEPFSAWLLQRSLATIHTRTIKQSKNAAKIVERLKSHPRLARIHYPTLFDGEQARIYREQCTAPGGMIAFEVAGGEEAAFRFLDSLRLARIAVSFGGVESLATHPRTTVSSEMSDEELARCGVADGLVRFSTGVEYWRDLADDLDQALAKA